MAPGDAGGEDPEDGPQVDLDGASNVLVLSEAMDEEARQSYFESLVPGPPAEIDVLGIDYGRTPEEWLDEWRRRAGGTPRRSAIVAVDDVTRSATSAGQSAAAGRQSAGAGDETSVGPGAVTCVESPTDLTGIGIRVQQSLSEFGGPETVVTFDSLTALLHYVEIDRAFRFLHVLTSRVTHAGAVGYYHVDPAAHDDRTLATLRTLFDAVATYDDGSWSVEVR